jgi:hypothetical protein
MPKWTPFEEATLPDNFPHHIDSPVRVLMNSIYQVNVYEHETKLGPMLELSIKRRDKEIIRDWRELQRIKNEILGSDIEAVELFPHEDRLVDTSNQYHLWCLPSGLCWPFGYDTRVVAENSGKHGAKQRPFDEDDRPEDCVSAEDMDMLYEKLVGNKDGN